MHSTRASRARSSTASAPVKLRSVDADVKGMSEIGAATAETTAPEQLDEQLDERDGAGAGAALPQGDGTGPDPPRRSGRSTRMMGEVVVDLGFADRQTVDDAVETARSQGRPTGLVLVEQGVLRHDQLAPLVAERFGPDSVDLTVFDL